jgi:hypothetical protein
MVLSLVLLVTIVMPVVIVVARGSEWRGEQAGCEQGGGER